MAKIVTDAIAEDIADIKRDCMSFAKGCPLGSAQERSWLYIERRLGQVLAQLDPAVAEAAARNQGN